MGIVGIRLKGFLPLVAGGNAFDFTPKAVAFRRIQPVKDFRPVAFVQTELNKFQELCLQEREILLVVFKCIFRLAFELRRKGGGINGRVEDLAQSRENLGV